MIGKLTYDQIDQLIEVMNSSNNNLRQVLEYYSNDNELGLKTSKLLQFCNDVDRYINNLKEMVILNKDADVIIDRLKNQ